MRRVLLAALISTCPVFFTEQAEAQASDQIATSGGSPGVIVMAHGGSADWNQTVLDAVAPTDAENWRR